VDGGRGAQRSTPLVVDLGQGGFLLGARDGDAQGFVVVGFGPPEPGLADRLLQVAFDVGIVHRLERRARRLLVAWGGIEPPTRGFSIRCSTN
jgi:hypothetical protein